MSCSVNVNQILTPPNTLVVQRQQDAGDPGSIVTTNIIITDDRLQKIEVVDVCRGTQGPSGPSGPEGPEGPPGQDGVQFEVLPIVSGGTNNTSFNADYIIYYDGANDQLASTNYTIQDILNGVQALTGIVEGSGIQTTDLGNNQTRIDAIAGYGLDIDPVSNAIYLTGVGQIQPNQLAGILPINKGGTANTVYSDGKLIAFDASALNGSGQFISATNLDIDDIVVSGNGFTLTAGSGLVNGGFVIIPNGTGRIDIPESADITVFADSFELSQTGTPGTYSKVTTDSKGRVESGGQLTPSDIYNILGYIPWHSGNDGCGSQLDADMLCGQSGDYYLDATNITGVINTGVLPDIMIDGRYTKVDVNTKGLVTSGMQMTPEDIEIILGYPPVRPTGGVDFCGDVELHGSLFIEAPTGCPGATNGLLRVYDNLPMVARNNPDISPSEPRGVSFVYGGGLISRTGSIAYFPTDDLVKVTTNMAVNNNGVDGGDSDDDFQDDINGGNANSEFPINNLTGTQRILLYKDTADELYVSRLFDQIVFGFKTFKDGLGVNDQVIIYDKAQPTVPPTNVGNNTLLNVNFNADLLDGEHGDYYLDAGNMTGVFDPSKVTFGFIQGTPNYIPKFFDNGVDPANTIRDSIMFQSTSNNIVLEDGSNLVVGNNNNHDVSSNDNNIIAGTDHTVNSTVDSLIVGDSHNTSNSTNITLLGNSATNSADRVIAHGNYGEGWIEGQISHGAFEVRDSDNVKIEHGQATDFLMYLEGTTASSWQNLSPSVQLPDDHTIGFKVTLLMNSAFSTGVAEFEFLSGIAKNVTFRDPVDPTSLITETLVVQQPKKHEIYNNSYIHRYDFQLRCNDLGEIQSEGVEYDAPPIKVNGVNIENLPKTINLAPEQPDGYNATYSKDNLGGLSIDIDPASLTGNYVTNSNGDFLIYCNNHGLTVGTYTELTFDSYSDIAVPDQRYRVINVVDENTFVAEKPYWKAEKQTNNGNAVITLLPEAILEKDQLLSTETVVDIVQRSGVNLRYYDNPSSYDEIVYNERADRAKKALTVDSNALINDTPVVFVHDTGNTDFTFSSGDQGVFFGTGLLSYYDYTWEYFRKSESIRFSGNGSVIQYTSPNTLTTPLFTEPNTIKYDVKTYTSNETYVYQNAYAGDLWTSLNSPPTGLTIELTQPFASIPDGSFINVGAVVENSGSVRVQQRQKKTATYERINYNTNALIDCVYTRYTNTNGESAVHIYAEEYVDLGLLDRPYSFSLFDNQIGSNDNDKFKIVEDNDLYYLYTNANMPLAITDYTIEIEALDHYGNNQSIKKFNIAVADSVISVNQEEGLDDIVLLNNGIVQTGTPADTFITVISGVGGYDPYVTFEQGYNSFIGLFTSGSSLVQCTGVSQEYETTTLYGDPCGLCTGVNLLVDFEQGPPNQVVQVEEVWCVKDLQATPLLNSSKVIYTYPAISQNSVRVGQKFNIGSVEYTVGSELPQTPYSNKYGFFATTSANASTERIALSPNIEWINYTGLPSNLFQPPQGITASPEDVFEPRVPESGLLLDSNVEIELEFDEPVTNLVFCFSGVQASNLQAGYILQEDQDEILLEDGLGSLLNDFAYATSGAIISDRPLIVIDKQTSLPITDIVPTMVSFTGLDCRFVLCATGTFDRISFTAVVDQGTTYALSIGELVPKNIDTSNTALIQIDTPYTGYNNNENYITVAAEILYTGTLIDSGNLPISGLKEGNVFFNCQENSSSGVYGYETTQQYDEDACYVTGQCQVYSAKTSIDENGEVLGQASYKVTFDEDIYISQNKESYVQLTNWTPTDSNPERTIVPEEGHYPISILSDITSNSFVIPEEYAIALPVPGTGMSRKGTVSGEFDIYHPYKIEDESILNHIPAQFLTIERTYNPPVTNPNYKPKDNIFEIMGITGSKIFTEDKVNYVLIEDNRPPYLDQKISGNYVTDSREFYATTSPFSNRLRDLTFDPDNMRDLNYADAPWSLKDIYVLADYDSANSRLTLYNVPTGVFRPLDTIQVSFNSPTSANNSGCNLFPIYHDVPAENMYLYTGLPITEPSGENIGNILFTFSEAPPEGWVVLDGSTYDRTQYPALAQYLDFHRVLYSSGWALGNEGWTASTLPDLRKVTPVGQHENTLTAFSNIGEIVRDTGNKLLLENNKNGEFGQADNIVGNWIMYTQGSFIDPRYPINFSDSGTLNYVIDNVDIKDSDGDKTENFITPYARVRIDILQFLEPDIRMNYQAGEDEPNYIYIQHQPEKTNQYDISEPNVLIDPNGCAFTGPYSDPYKVYTPTNEVTVKLRYDEKGGNGQQYSLVLDNRYGMKNFEEDLGFVRLYTPKMYDFDAGITGMAWWPEGVLPLSIAHDGPARTPLQYASGGNSTPTGWGIVNSPMVFEYDTDIVPNEEIVFGNYTMSGNFGIWVKISGEVTDASANTAVRVLHRKYDQETQLACRKINNPSSDGYVVSDNNGGSQLFSIPHGHEVVIQWANGICDDTEIPEGTGTLYAQIYGGIYPEGRGTPVYIDVPSNFYIREDFIEANERNPNKNPRRVYQLPSVELKNNVCSPDVRYNGEWFTLPYKASIDSLNVPKSYLEYGDEFKLMSINKNSNFSDKVTRILTKINPTSETTSVSGLATSSDLCRFIPCTTDSVYTKYRKTTMWGDHATDDYPAVSNLNYRVTGYFESGSVQHIDFMDIFPLSEDQFTFTVNMYNEDDLPFTGCVLTEEDGSWVSMAEYVGCTSQDQKTVTFEAFPRSVSLKVAMQECSGIVRFSVTTNDNAVSMQENFPKSWSDPLLITAANCPLSYANNTFKNIDTFWQSPFESCNTGLYQDRPRSATPFGLQLNQDIGWTGICEFVPTVSGRMYIPENNNLYFHTYGGTAAHWPLDYKGSGTPTQQTGVYIIDDVPDFGAVNSCSSGLMCIAISGWNNNPITGIPIVGDRNDLGSNPIVIESNGVTGIISNYGANKRFFFDFDDGLPQMSKVYNVIDYIDGTRKIVINAPYDSSVVNKSGLVFMIENDENIKTHLNPNVDNEFNVYDPNVVPSDIFDPQINHFDLNTRRWKHLLHYDFDAIGTGLQEVTVSISGTSQDVNIYPIYPVGINLSGVRISQNLNGTFEDYSSGDAFTINDKTSTFYMQVVTLDGQPPFTDNAFVEIPKVSISGIQDYEFVFDDTIIVDGAPFTSSHGSGWNIGIQVNRTEEEIDGRLITVRAEDITGKSDIALSFSQTGTPEVLQSYTGYSLVGDNTWLIIYDLKNIELNTPNIDFELLGSPAAANQITYQPVRDNVLAVSGPVDPAATTTQYYDVSLIAKTGPQKIPAATGTGLLVDLKFNRDWYPLNLTLNNFNSFGKRGESGIFYLDPAIDEAITFQIPQPQGNIISQGGDPFEVSYINQSSISEDMGYLLSAGYATNERRFVITLTPTGVDGEYYQRTDRFANQQLKITIPYNSYDSNNVAVTPTPSQTLEPVFDTILYTGLQLSNTNPNTVQYYEQDEPWTIQVKVTGGVIDHDPTNPPNFRIFNAPNQGSYANNNNPIDCIVTYTHQNDPGNTCWIVNATARRDVLGQYMPNQTGEFRLVVNADDGLTDYATLNEANGINDQFVIIYNKPSGFINLPPLLHSVPSAPFFTHCDVLSPNSQQRPSIVPLNLNGISLTSIDYRYDFDFPLWQRAYRGTQGNNYIWDAKVEISNNGLITSSVKAIGDDRVQAVAKFETLEIESDQLKSVPFRILSVTPAATESEDFPPNTGIIVEQGEAWELTVTTIGGIQDIRYPPTVLLNNMPTFCTGYNPLDSDANQDQQCIDGEPNFDGSTWSFKFSGQPSCDLLGIYPFDILALDTLPGNQPSPYIASDTFDGQFIYETGEFTILPPTIQFTGETILFPECNTCYTGYIDFGPTIEEDLDCNGVTGVKSISFSGTLPSGLDYEIFFPESTNGPAITRGKGTGIPPTVVFPAPWDNLASGYIQITGCPTHFATGGSTYTEFAEATVCNAVDACETITVQFEDGSEPIKPNIDFSFFFLHSGMVQTAKTGTSVLGEGGEVSKSYAPSAQEYNLDCGTRLEISECRTYHVFYSGEPGLGQTHVSGIYPEGQPNNNKIDLEPYPNNFVFITGEDTTFFGRHIAEESPLPEYDVVLNVSLAGNKGTGLMVVEKVPQQKPKADKLNNYFDDLSFDQSTTNCILGNGTMGVGVGQGETTKYGVRGQVLPRLSGEFVDINSTFAKDDEYFTGLNLIEINQDTDVPIISLLSVADCYSTGYMRISGIAVPPVQTEITDPPPASESPYFSYKGQQFSLATRLSYGDTEEQRNNPVNRRPSETLYWSAYNSVDDVQITNGQVQSSGAFTFTAGSSSGVVYAIRIHNEADFAPSNGYDLKGYSENDYVWIHKGGNRSDQPVATTFPPIVPTGFSPSGLHLKQNVATNQAGLAYGGYVIPDGTETDTEGTKYKMIQAGVPAIPYWKTPNPGSQDYTSADYLPSISGMVLSSFGNLEPFTTSVNVETNETPRTGLIPVPDDYVGVGDRVDIFIGDQNNTFIDESYVLTANELLGSPVTGVQVTGSNTPYFGFQQLDATITKKIEVSGIVGGTGVVLYHPNIDYTIGDIVTLEVSGQSSSLYTACNDIDLTIVDGNTIGMELAVATTDNSWYVGLLQAGDTVNLNKQEAGEIFIPSNSITVSTEGQYAFNIQGTPTTLYKDYTFRIVTCENPQHPVYTQTSIEPKLYKKDYNMYVSKPINIVNSSVSIDGSRANGNWRIRFNLEGGLRPVRNHSPRVMLRYGSNTLGTFCGFTRTVVYGPPLDDPYQDNRLYDEYDAVNDQLIVELKQAEGFDWSGQSTIEIVVQDETGESTLNVTLP